MEAALFTTLVHAVAALIVTTGLVVWGFKQIG